jgi:hypothetical protein
MGEFVNQALAVTNQTSDDPKIAFACPGKLIGKPVYDE